MRKMNLAIEHVIFPPLALCLIFMVSSAQVKVKPTGQSLGWADTRVYDASRASAAHARPVLLGAFKDFKNMPHLSWQQESTSLLLEYLLSQRPSLPRNEVTLLPPPQGHAIVCARTQGPCRCLSGRTE